MSRSKSKRRSKSTSVTTDPPASQSESRDALRSRVIPASLAILLILASGIVHGLQTNRWTKSTELADAVERLNHVSKTLGDWVGEDVEIPEDQLRMAAAAGHVTRVYRNRITAESVSVMLLCGPHGPISVHPPTVCFIGSGWELETPPVRAEFSGENKAPSGEFWSAHFRYERESRVRRMRTRWAWNGTGSWEAPDSARFYFAGNGHLYKLYVSVIIPNREDEMGKDVTPPDVRFMQEFLPVLKQTLLAGATNAAE